MSKLKTNSIGPVTEKDVTVTGLRSGRSPSSRDGVIKYEDEKFQFRQDGEWITFDHIHTHDGDGGDEDSWSYKTEEHQWIRPGELDLNILGLGEGVGFTDFDGSGDPGMIVPVGYMPTLSLAPMEYIYSIGDTVMFTAIVSEPGGDPADLGLEINEIKLVGGSSGTLEPEFVSELFNGPLPSDSYPLDPSGPSTGEISASFSWIVDEHPYESGVSWEPRFFEVKVKNLRTGRYKRLFLLIAVRPTPEHLGIQVDILSPATGDEHLYSKPMDIEFVVRSSDISSGLLASEAYGAEGISSLLDAFITPRSGDSYSYDGYLTIKVQRMPATFNSTESIRDSEIASLDITSTFSADDWEWTWEAPSTGDERLTFKYIGDEADPFGSRFIGSAYIIVTAEVWGLESTSRDLDSATITIMDDSDHRPALIVNAPYKSDFVVGENVPFEILVRDRYDDIGDLTVDFWEVRSYEDRSFDDLASSDSPTGFPSLPGIDDGDLLDEAMGELVEEKRPLISGSPALEGTSEYDLDDPGVLRVTYEGSEAIGFNFEWTSDIWESERGYGARRLFNIVVKNSEGFENKVSVMLWISEESRKTIVQFTEDADGDGTASEIMPESSLYFKSVRYGYPLNLSAVFDPATLAGAYSPSSEGGISLSGQWYATKVPHPFDRTDIRSLEVDIPYSDLIPDEMIPDGTDIGDFLDGRGAFGGWVDPTMLTRADRPFRVPREDESGDPRLFYMHSTESVILDPGRWMIWLHVTASDGSWDHHISRSIEIPESSSALTSGIDDSSGADVTFALDYPTSLSPEAISWHGSKLVLKSTDGREEVMTATSDVSSHTFGLLSGSYSLSFVPADGASSGFHEDCSFRILSGESAIFESGLMDGSGPTSWCITVDGSTVSVEDFECEDFDDGGDASEGAALLVSLVASLINNITLTLPLPTMVSEGLDDVTQAWLFEVGAMGMPFVTTLCRYSLPAGNAVRFKKARRITASEGEESRVEEIDYFYSKGHELVKFYVHYLVLGEGMTAIEPVIYESGSITKRFVDMGYMGGESVTLEEDKPVFLSWEELEGIFDGESDFIGIEDGVGETAMHALGIHKITHNSENFNPSFGTIFGLSDEFMSVELEDLQNLIPDENHDTHSKRVKPGLHVAEYTLSEPLPLNGRQTFGLISSGKISGGDEDGDETSAGAIDGITLVLGVKFVFSKKHYNIRSRGEEMPLPPEHMFEESEDGGVWGDTDSDGDGWTDAEEALLGTDPLDPSSHPAVYVDTAGVADSDGDGFTDEYEVDVGTDPYDPSDYPYPGIVIHFDEDGDPIGEDTVPDIASFSLTFEASWTDGGGKARTSYAVTPEEFDAGSVVGTTYFLIRGGSGSFFDEIRDELTELESYTSGTELVGDGGLMISDGSVYFPVELHLNEDGEPIGFRGYEYGALIESEAGMLSRDSVSFESGTTTGGVTFIPADFLWDDEMFTHIAFYGEGAVEYADTAGVPDSDGDGFTDDYEVAVGTDPDDSSDYPSPGIAIETSLASFSLTFESYTSTEGKAKTSYSVTAEEFDAGSVVGTTYFLIRGGSGSFFDEIRDELTELESYTSGTELVGDGGLMISDGSVYFPVELHLNEDGEPIGFKMYEHGALLESEAGMLSRDGVSFESGITTGGVTFIPADFLFDAGSDEAFTRIAFYGEGTVEYVAMSTTTALTLRSFYKRLTKFESTTSKTLTYFGGAKTTSDSATSLSTTFILTPTGERLVETTRTLILYDVDAASDPYLALTSSDLEKTIVRDGEPITLTSHTGSEYIVSRTAASLSDTAGLIVASDGLAISAVYSVIPTTAWYADLSDMTVSAGDIIVSPEDGTSPTLISADEALWWPISSRDSMVWSSVRTIDDVEVHAASTRRTMIEDGTIAPFVIVSATEKYLESMVGEILVSPTATYEGDMTGYSYSHLIVSSVGVPKEDILAVMLPYKTEYSGFPRTSMVCAASRTMRSDEYSKELLLKPLSSIPYTPESFINSRVWMAPSPDEQALVNGEYYMYAVQDGAIRDVYYNNNDGYHFYQIMDAIGNNNPTSVKVTISSRNVYFSQAKLERPILPPADINADGTPDVFEGLLGSRTSSMNSGGLIVDTSGSSISDDIIKPNSIIRAENINGRWVVKGVDSEYELDSDKDMLSDDLEAQFGTNPNDPDSDDDGVSDGQEMLLRGILNEEIDELLNELNLILNSSEMFESGQVMSGENIFIKTNDSNSLVVEVASSGDMQLDSQKSKILNSIIVNLLGNIELE